MESASEMGSQAIMNANLRILPPRIALTLKVRNNLAWFAAERALRYKDKKFLAEVFAMRVNSYLELVSEGAAFEIQSRGTNGR